MTRSIVKCSAAILAGLLLVSSFSASARENHLAKQNKKTELTRAEIRARALSHCKRKHGPDALVGDLNIRNKPWRVTCSIHDNGYKDSFN
jgi:hypothetical protein